jgi:hypothetical protein
VTYLSDSAKLYKRIRKTEGFSIFWSIISGFVIGQATGIAGMAASVYQRHGNPNQLQRLV